MNKLVNNMNLMLAGSDKPVAAWITSSFPIIKIVLAVLILLCSIFMIIAVIAQKGEANGSASITGTTDTFYNRNKGTSLQGVIKKLTIIVAIILVVLCVLFLVLNSIYEGTV